MKSNKINGVNILTKTKKKGAAFLKIILKIILKIYKNRYITLRISNKLYLKVIFFSLLFEGVKIKIILHLKMLTDDNILCERRFRIKNTVKTNSFRIKF